MTEFTHVFHAACRVSVDALAHHYEIAREVQADYDGVEIGTEAYHALVVRDADLLAEAVLSFMSEAMQETDEAFDAECDALTNDGVVSSTVDIAFSSDDSCAKSMRALVSAGLVFDSLLKR